MNKIAIGKYSVVCLKKKKEHTQHLWLLSEPLELTLSSVFLRQHNHLNTYHLFNLSQLSQPYHDE